MNRELPSAFVVCPHDIDAIRYEDMSNAGITRLSATAAAAVMKDNALRFRLRRHCCSKRGQACSERPCAGHHLPSRRPLGIVHADRLVPSFRRSNTADAIKHNGVPKRELPGASLA